MLGFGETMAEKAMLNHCALLQSLVDMIHPVDPNATWRQLMPNVKLLAGLREVNLGPIPVTELCSVCEMLPALEVLKAGSIIDHSSSQPL